MADPGETERILAVLRPYGANWSGSLGRGDLVIPRTEIPRLINNLIDAIVHTSEPGAEVSEIEWFGALREARRLPSVQDQAATLRQRFRILKR